VRAMAVERFKNDRVQGVDVLELRRNGPNGNRIRKAMESVSYSVRFIEEG
jgi:hypothetical protein